MIRRKAQEIESGRRAQFYMANLTDEKRALREDFSKVPFVEYGECELENVMNMQTNIDARVNALLGYRNELALKMDPVANLARLQIILDETRVANTSSSKQTPDEQ